MNKEPKEHCTCLGCKSLGLDPEGAYCMATENWDAIDDPNRLRFCLKFQPKD